MKFVLILGFLALIAVIFYFLGRHSGNQSASHLKDLDEDFTALRRERDSLASQLDNAESALRDIAAGRGVPELTASAALNINHKK